MDSWPYARFYRGHSHGTSVRICSNSSNRRTISYHPEGEDTPEKHGGGRAQCSLDVIGLLSRVTLG